MPDVQQDDILAGSGFAFNCPDTDDIELQLEMESLSIEHKEDLLDEYQLVEFEIMTLDPPEPVIAECWEWRYGGLRSELAPTKEQALIDQREYIMEMLE